MEKIYVLGASGTVGAEVARLLKEQDRLVIRATSRTPAERDQVRLDLVTREGLESITGVDKLFLLAPPGHVNQDELLIPVIERARAARVKKVVLMTAMGVDAGPETPLRRTELYLESSGLAYNIIRPNWFMQNFNSYWIQGINGQGRILLPVGSARGSFIDARDIAAVAATLLASDAFSPGAFDLTGGEALDHDEVAAILSQTTGRPITFQSISAAQMRDQLLQAGLPVPYAEFLLVILDFFRQGFAERITDSVERITGRKPISFATYARDHKDAWKV